MRKIPKCPICGGPHYKYMCFQNPKRKYALKRKYSAYKVGKTPKKDKVLSSSKSLVRKRLILELDKYCSLCVRIAAADKNGIATCYCCGRRLPWKCMHNGHFKSRQFQGTRFDFENMRCCCETCLTGEAILYKEDFSPIRQEDVKVGDMILARNPMSKGVMITEVEAIRPVEVGETKIVDVDGDCIEGSLDHRVETEDGFVSIKNLENHNIIKVWKK